ncbi:hypothetical protein W97_05906 [Coniosporium apollinis CBS 100218]|uniref:Uncharacterized protein n=1 Tax=Coniosporium apollinis (strain CBS 100218) TaxID=1168221 RepID=R7YXK6_CONA1|nr:uncharacterized protein W97_05906 [Coniosporium apollinis CBS 100218]EON66660.1 hypothetical protein W97_05906 [Coniosporium apollinis CBS 100218]
MATDGSSLEMHSHTYQELKESSWTCKNCGVLNSFVPVAQQPVGLLICDSCHKPAEAGTQVFSNILEILPDCIEEQTLPHPGSKRSTGNKSEKRKQKPEGLVPHLATFHFSTSVCKFCVHKCCENCLRFRLREKGISASAAKTADLVEEVIPLTAADLGGYLSRFPLNDVRGLRVQTQPEAAQTASHQAPPVSPVSAKLILDNPIVLSPDLIDAASITSVDSEVEYGVAVERKLVKVSTPPVLYRRPTKEWVSKATVAVQTPSNSLPETKRRTVHDQKEDEEKALKESTDAMVNGLLRLGFL